MAMQSSHDYYSSYLYHNKKFPMSIYLYPVKKRSNISTFKILEKTKQKTKSMSYFLMNKSNHKKEQYSTARLRTIRLVT